MSYSPDPHRTQSIPSPEKTVSPKTRVSWLWYVASIVIVLGIVLGLILKVRSSSSSQPSTPSPSASENRLFSNTSPWNLPIGSNVQFDPNSSGMVSLLASGQHVPTLYRFGMPMYTSAASDPVYTVQDSGNDSTFEANMPIHIPDTAAPSPGSDHWMFVFDTTKHLIFEMWKAKKQGDMWTAQTGNVYSPTGDGIHQVDGSLQSGNGGSYFGGVVTQTDLARGYIDHALSFVTQYTATTWRYPMSASDGQGTDPNDLPMGARLQLDPSINCDTLAGASIGEKIICHALQTYGGYIRDTGGVALSIYFEGEDLKDPNRNPPKSPGNPGRPGGAFDQVGLHDAADLSHIPWDKLRVLQAWNSFTSLSTPPSAMFAALSPAMAC